MGMSAEIDELARAMARLITENRLDALAGLHLFPCAYEARGAMQVLHDPAALARVVGTWREAQWAQGVRRIEAQVVARDARRGPRLRAWVRWVHHLESGTVEDGGTDLLYLHRTPGGRLAVEMIDFLSLPDPAERAPALAAAR